MSPEHRTTIGDRPQAVKATIRRVSRWQNVVRTTLLVVAPLVAGGVAAQPASRPSAGPVLPGEWMLPATSSDTWKALEALPARIGLRVGRREAGHGVIVTAPADVDTTVFGPLEAAGLPASPTRTRLELHLHVMRGLEPARLAIGVVTDSTAGGTVSRTGRTVHEVRRFGNAIIAARVLREIEAALGVVGEPLGALPAARASQAVRLLPAGVDAGCGTREAPMASRAQAVDRPPARTRHEVAPVYPRGALESKRDGVVEVEAELTEHGTLAQAALVGTRTLDDELARAALGAFELWRFSPLVQAGCPARVRLTLGSRFRAE